MSLTKFSGLQTSDRVMGMLQDRIAGSVNPVIDKALVDGELLTSVPLASGSNTVDHKLGRKLVGWCVVRQRASATLYDTQDSNTNPSRTLVLVASAPVTVDLWVF